MCVMIPKSSQAIIISTGHRNAFFSEINWNVVFLVPLLAWLALYTMITTSCVGPCAILNLDTLRCICILYIRCHLLLLTEGRILTLMTLAGWELLWNKCYVITKMCFYWGGTTDQKGNIYAYWCVNCISQSIMFVISTINICEQKFKNLRGGKRIFKKIDLFIKSELTTLHLLSWCLIYSLIFHKTAKNRHCLKRIQSQHLMFTALHLETTLQKEPHCRAMSWFRWESIKK